jgi:hypothetical protein
MNVFSTIGKALTGASAAGGGFDPVTSVANLVNTVVQRVVPDKQAQEQAKLAIAEMQLNGELANMAGQIQTNIAEAASSHVFVAGWRPYVGWICGTALAYEMLMRPLLTFLVAVCGGHAVAGAIQTQDLFTVLLGMLGLAAARTVEKVNDCSTATDRV